MEEMGSHSHICPYSFPSGLRNPIATCVSLPWGWGSPVHGSRKQLPHSIVFVSHCRHFVVTSHALKKSETVKQTQHTQHNNNTATTHNNNNNNNTIWGGSVLTGEEPPPHSGELKHALPQAGGPTQSQLSRPVSSGHHISMKHRLRRKHLNSDTNASNKKYLKEIQEKRKEETFSSEKKEKRK